MLRGSGRLVGDKVVYLPIVGAALVLTKGGLSAWSHEDKFRVCRRSGLEHKGGDGGEESV